MMIEMIGVGKDQDRIQGKEEKAASHEKQAEYPLAGSQFPIPEKKFTRTQGKRNNEDSFVTIDDVSNGQQGDDAIPPML